MTVVPTRSKVLALYRALLHNGRLFADYNFREYTVRIIRDDFQRNKDVTDDSKKIQLYEEGLQRLAMVKRQATINRMFASNQVMIDDTVIPKNANNVF